MTERAIFRVQDQRFGIDDVREALRAAGVEPGETIMVHSDISSFGKLGDLRDRKSYALAFVDALLEALGPDGNLVVPTFSHSFTRNEIYDPETTPSTVGTLSEEFRKMGGVRRSLDPIFSVAVVGPDRGELAEVGTDCFGEGSIFDKLHRRNARFVFLGETFDLTFIHYVEQRLGVPYRFLKRFSGRIRVGGELVERSVDYFVRPLDGSVVYDVEKLARFFAQRGLLRSVALGLSRVRSVRALEAFEAIVEGLRADPLLLLKS